MRCFVAFGERLASAYGRGKLSGGHQQRPRDGRVRFARGRGRQIKILRNKPEQLSSIARAGHEMVSTRYSKEVQWTRFEALVASI